MISKYRVYARATAPTVPPRTRTEFLLDVLEFLLIGAPHTPAPPRFPYGSFWDCSMLSIRNSRHRDCECALRFAPARLRMLWQSVARSVPRQHILHPYMVG